VYTSNGTEDQLKSLVASKGAVIVNLWVTPDIMKALQVKTKKSL
jgi:hypothetical protein